MKIFRRNKCEHVIDNATIKITYVHDRYGSYNATGDCGNCGHGIKWGNVYDYYTGLMKNTRAHKSAWFDSTPVAV